MSGALPVYVFRSSDFARAGDTVVCAAPFDHVVSIYGGGGVKGVGGLSAAFGGAAMFKDEATGACFLGVWGARNASRFRSALRASGAVINIIRESPPARMIFFEKNYKRAAGR